jgi:GGDEF domain-containing protein
MKNLKIPLIQLLLFLVIVFNIDSLTLATNNLLEFHRFMDVLIAGIVILTLLFRIFRKLPGYANLAFWLSIYFGLWFLLNKNVSPELNLLVILIEVIFISVTIMLARDVAKNIYELESTLDKLFLAAFQGRTMSMDEASDEIKTELMRSRRYQRSLTVIVLEPDQASVDQNLVPTAEEIRHNLSKRYAMGKISEVLNSTARRPDLIIKLDQPDRFILVCPETSASSSNTLIQRIQSAVETDLGISVSWGIATFPDDALTFEDLLHKANAKLLNSSSFSLSKPKKGETVIKKP